MILVERCDELCREVRAVFEIQGGFAIAAEAYSFRLVDSGLQELKHKLRDAELVFGESCAPESVLAEQIVYPGHLAYDCGVCGSC